MAAAGGDEMAVLAWGLRLQAAGVGRSTGIAFGEAFRHERFHPLVEAALAGALPGA
jgi:hypothetical protein